MDTNQPTTPTTTYAPAASPGMFGTKIPSSVAFIVAVLLFFMPFADIKCNNMSLQQVSGIQLATGFKMKNNSSDNSFLNDIKSETVDQGITKATTKTDKKEPNMYALIALGLAVLGLALSFTNAKASIGGAMVTGIASAGALIGMMLDIKKKAKLEMPDIKDKTPDNDIGNTIDKIGDKMNDLTDKMNISVDFTPWFYIAVIALLAAAFFCYKRMSAVK
jgi:multidrug transporter EmrE-like cation transporter